MFPPSTLEAIRRRADLAAIIGERVKLKRIGATQDYLGLCPFHREKTPSLRVHPTQYYCFGCGVTGDAITFLRAIDGLTFPEAVRQLAERTGVPLDDSMPSDEYRQRRAVADEIAAECRYWISIGGFSRFMRQAMLPDIECRAFDWCAANPGCDGPKWEAAWKILAGADQKRWDACNAAIRDASADDITAAYLEYRAAHPEFRRLYRLHVEFREREDVECRAVTRNVVSNLEWLAIHDSGGAISYQDICSSSEKAARESALAQGLKTSPEAPQ